MRDLADYFSCQAVAKIPVCLENREGPSSPEAKTCTLDLPLVKPRIIPRSFYGRSPDAVARGLLGKLLLHRWEGHRLMGRILETEAYGGQDDPASRRARCGEFRRQLDQRPGENIGEHAIGGG